MVKRKWIDNMFQTKIHLSSSHRAFFTQVSIGQPYGDSWLDLYSKMVHPSYPITWIMSALRVRIIKDA